MAASQLKLEGFGPEDAEIPELPGSSFPASTLTSFIEASISGIMPGGVKTEQPLFPKEYMSKFTTKYVDWAPPPFDKLPPPAIEAIGPIPGGAVQGESPPPIIRVTQVISGMDRIFSTMFNQSSNIEPSLKAVRSRLWFGMPPMSDACWTAKGLDEEENIEEAMAVIQQAADVFKYQLRPDVQGEMRTMHNKSWTEIDVFQDAIVALRSQNGEPPPEFNIAKLWQEYIQCQFQYMENQARAWAFERLNILYNCWKDRLLRKLISGRIISESQLTIWIDHWALMILNRLLDLYVEAEIFLRACTLGFAMAQGIAAPLVGAITLDKSEDELDVIYAGMENKRVSDLRGTVAAVTASETAQRRADPDRQFPDFTETTSLLIDRENAMRRLLRQMEAPLTFGAESWIQSLAARDATFGFVIYRTTHTQNRQEWESFVVKLEAALNSGWEGVVDPENVKRKAILHWVDGKEEKIPEGDIDAVRQHFKTYSKNPFLAPGLTKTTCLAINIESFNSFSRTGNKHDYQGFLVAIETSYDASKERDKSGFSGSFNIHHQLVWTDLFALKACCSGQHANEYFQLAMQHPWGMYVGPTTGILRKKWRIMKEMMTTLAGALARR